MKGGVAGISVIIQAFRTRCIIDDTPIKKQRIRKKFRSLSQNLSYSITFRWSESEYATILHIDFLWAWCYEILLLKITIESDFKL